jgi:hypothetical protein
MGDGAAGALVRGLVQRLVGRLRQPGDILVIAAPEDALFASAVALRRLGARITRYDADDGSLEARAATGDATSVVRIRATTGGGGATRLSIEGGGESRRLIRRFRTELSRSE